MQHNQPKISQRYLTQWLDHPVTLALLEEVTSRREEYLKAACNTRDKTNVATLNWLLGAITVFDGIQTREILRDRIGTSEEE